MSHNADKIASFKTSARFYLSNKQLLMKKQKKSASNSDDQLIKYLQEDINFVEEILDEIYQECGSAARLIVYRVFVEGVTQSDVARENNMTRRKLQYSINKWLATVFENAASEDE